MHPSLEVILPPVTYYLHWNPKQRVNYLSVLKPQCALVALAVSPSSVPLSGPNGSSGGPTSLPPAKKRRWRGTFTPPNLIRPMLLSREAVKTPSSLKPPWQREGRAPVGLGSPFVMGQRSWTKKANLHAYQEEEFHQEVLRSSSHVNSIACLLSPTFVPEDHRRMR